MRMRSVGSRLPSGPAAAALFAALVLAGCGSATANEGSYRVGAAATADAARGTPNLIVREQVRAAQTMQPTALELVRELRPQWLRARGNNTLNSAATNGPRVYLDHIHYGPISWLREIRSDHVQRIEFVNPRDATTRWGTNHTGGVIHVFTIE